MGNFCKKKAFLTSKVDHSIGSPKASGSLANLARAFRASNGQRSMEPIHSAASLQLHQID